MDFSEINGIYEVFPFWVIFVGSSLDGAEHLFVSYFDDYYDVLITAAN